ncbi:catalase [Echinicola marina]|uniref:catalase n=1 Tax=Echinicola marina TaxID=2859768 RepID=UPI001CF624AD|nr:catalase [Echinicola marina]UCS95786.1 catalase [Echinicola marina]
MKNFNDEEASEMKTKDMDFAQRDLMSQDEQENTIKYSIRDERRLWTEKTGDHL